MLDMAETSDEEKTMRNSVQRLVGPQGDTGMVGTCCNFCDGPHGAQIQNLQSRKVTKFKSVTIRGKVQNDLPKKSSWVQTTRGRYKQKHR